MKVDGVEFPEPSDPRWQRIGTRHYSLGPVFAWSAWRLPFWVKLEVSSAIGGSYKSYRRCRRYVAAVIRANEQRADQSANAVVERL